MQTENWNRLQNVWKGEKKPRVDIEELKAEVRSRKKRNTFNTIVETCIVVAVIIFTLFRLTNQTNPFDYILLGQLWLVTILALVFNFWNRSSLKKADSYSVAEYLKLLLNESLKKKRTAVFVFVLILVNLLFYIFLFLSEYIQFTDITTFVSAICLLLIYTFWSVWYYKIASSNISYYRKELRKIMEL
jgi:hypothetical protein